VASRLLSVAISTAWCLPPWHARPVVYGGRQLDVNALAVLRALPAAGHPHPVLLVHDAAAARTALVTSEDDDFSGVEIRHVRSAAALLRLAGTRLFLFTHFVYGSPRPRGRRLLVNVWHGDGPKSPLFAGERPHRAESHVLVSNNRAWGEVTAEAFGLPLDRLWLVGNPRVDEMRRPTSDAALRRLGLDPEVPILLWAPTFRTATYAGIEGWEDAAGPAAFTDVLGAPDSPLRAVHDSGRLQVVVKPHPFDPTDFGAAGGVVLTNEDLAAAGTNLYRFMGRCAALMTDYSSIWTDFVALDRPVVLYCPDVAGYTAGRGFAGVSFADAAPGPVVETAEELHDVLAKVADGVDVGHEQRWAACRTLGVELRFGATDRLLGRVAAES
jgi:hypothetical protein